MIQNWSSNSRFWPIAGWFLLAAVLILGWACIDNIFYLRLMMVAGIFIIAVIPFDLLVGYMGYLAMGQAAFFGTGAYIVGNLTVLRFECNFWFALFFALVCLAIVAYLLSFPLFRLRGHHFSIGTLAIGQLSWLVFDSWEWFTGGAFGTNGIPRPSVGGIQMISNSRYYLLVAFFVFITALFCWVIAQGSIGRALRAIRQDEDLAAARGLNVLFYKRVVFVIAAVFAGLAGALFAPMAISIDPSSFTIWKSFQFVIFTMVGGVGTLIGPALGVIFITILDQLIQEFGKWNQLVLGLFILLAILFFRGGLWGGIKLLYGTGLRFFSGSRAGNAAKSLPNSE